MKKTISIILSLLIVISSLSIVNLSALASEVVSFSSVKENAVELETNQSKSGSFDVLYDEADYKITLPKDGKLDISFLHDFVQNGSHHIYSVMFFDSRGQVIRNQEITYYETLTDFAPIGLRENDVLYIAVRLIHKEGLGVGYTISNTYSESNGEWEAEYNDTKDTANELILNGSTSANMASYSHVDWFKLTVPADGKLNFVLTHDATFNGAHTWYEVKVFDSSNNTILDAQSNYYDARVDFISLNLSANETVYVKIDGHTEGYDVTYNLSNTFTPTFGECETENNNTPNLADVFVPNGSISGNLTIYDKIDCYKITPTTNGVMTLKFKHDYTNIYSGSSMYKVSVSDSNKVIDNFEVKGEDIETISNPIDVKANTTYLISVEAGREYQGFEYTLSNTIHTHKYATTITKATASADGKIVKKCVCGKTQTTTIKKVSTVKLSTTKYTYNGSVKSPTLTVKDSSGKALVKGTDYTVSVPKGRKAVGKYTYKITFKGNYSGTKSLSFVINPKNTSISKLTATKGGFKAIIKKYTTQTTGYQIRYSTSSKMAKAKTVTVAKNTTTSKTVSKLAKGKKYYVQIRTYKTVGNTKYYSSWSKAKTVTTKK